MRNIDDKVKIEEKIKKKNEDLRLSQEQLVLAEKMASLGRLTAGVAHEINNPLNFISGGTNALEDFVERINKLIITLNTTLSKQEYEPIRNQIQLDELSKISGHLDKILKSIHNGVNRIIELQKGLMIYSRSKTDEFVPINIHELINATLIVLSNRYKNTVDIDLQYGDIPEIKCNPGKLNQVFDNIINNAIHAIEDQQFHDKKGIIVIKTRLANDSKHVIITLSNNGTEIPKEISESIFEPFFTTKPVGKGTGLGLSIVYSIIKEHKGEIKVRTEQLSKFPNCLFTSFEISLPII